MLAMSDMEGAFMLAMRESLLDTCGFSDLSAAAVVAVFVDLDSTSGFRCPSCSSFLTATLSRLLDGFFSFLVARSSSSESNSA